MSWTTINAGLGDPFVLALSLDPWVCRRLYAGTDDGVWEVAMAGKIEPASAK